VIVEVDGKPVLDLEGFMKATAAICEGKTEPTPVVVAFERRAERYLTLVEVGIRTPQPPTSEAKKAWLGVATQVLARKLARAVGLKGKKGVRITQVFPESNAAAAGLEAGDVVTHIDGQAVEASEPHDVEVFADMIRGYKPGTTVELTVLRGGKPGEPVKLKANLTEAPKPERELHVYEDTVLELTARDVAYLDRIRRRWPMDEGGALVTQVEEGGWAAVGRLYVEDLIKSVDGEAIANVKDLERVLKAAHEKRPKVIAMLVKRGTHTRFVEIEPRWPEKPAGK
jgi:serine protease Do